MRIFSFYWNNGGTNEGNFFAVKSLLFVHIFMWNLVIFNAFEFQYGQENEQYIKYII